MRLALTAAAALLAAVSTVSAASPQTAPAPSSTTLVEFCLTPDGVCPLRRPAEPGTACSCRWPKGNTSQGQAGDPEAPVK